MGSPETSTPSRRSTRKTRLTSLTSVRTASALCSINTFRLTEPPGPTCSGASSNETYVGVVNLFKFSPATTGNYEFVAQCSNRGTCDDGQCECFKGYTNDNCDVQSSLAV